MKAAAVGCGGRGATTPLQLLAGGVDLLDRVTPLLPNLASRRQPNSVSRLRELALTDAALILTVELPFVIVQLV